MNLFAPSVKAIFSMMGTIMGAGLFALPFAFTSIGLFWGTVLYAGLAIGMMYTHLAYLDEIAEVGAGHRLRYLIENRFGKRVSWLPAISYPTQLFAINYAYLLMGGSFVGMIAYWFGIQLNEVMSILLFWLLFSIISQIGIALVSRVEVYITAAMIVTLVLMGVLQLPAIQQVPFFVASPSILFAFGVFLFSASGISGIGEIYSIAKNSKKEARHAVIFGTLGSALLSWFFGAAFYLSSNGQLSQRIVEFNSYIPSSFQWLLPLLGLTGIASSYLTASVELETVLKNDFHWTKIQSRILTYFLPVILLAFVTRAFVQVISFAGSVFIGLNAFMICLLALRSAGKLPEMQKRYTRGLYALLAFIYLLSAGLALAKPFH